MFLCSSFISKIGNFDIKKRNKSALLYARDEWNDDKHSIETLDQIQKSYFLDLNLRIYSLD